MAYTDFSIDSVKNLLGITIKSGDLFLSPEPVAVRSWLRDLVGRGRRQFLSSEKARSEFLVTPILLACEELCGGAISIYSGQRLDVDPARGLVGECDFILGASPVLPGLQAPLVMIVEAKKHDIEGGIWQCFAQMVGAQVFNERSDRSGGEVFGCVTNGEAWQFLRLSGQAATIDRGRLYIDNLGAILAAFVAAFQSAGVAGPEPLPA